VKNLVNTTPRELRRAIDEFLQLHDFEGEGYTSAAKQRDLSVRFHWGHDHDFGAFSLDGMNGGNHLHVIRFFSEELGVLPKCLDGKSILDIGCWTGGTSLLLCAMGASVVAIEEVKKYADCLAYLTQAFGVEKLEPKNLSLYECTTSEFQDAFDYALFCGVLYHLTDPILALRIVFNSLKDGGTCLLETAITPSDGLELSYKGPTDIWAGSEEEMNRRGWNWFSPRVALSLR
jgi:SAM-dependent methyltransferase